MLIIRYSSVGQLIGSVALGFAISGAIAGIVITHSVIQSEQRARESLDRAASAKVVTTPDSAPRLAQESIDAAIRLYQIEIPKNVKGPVLDLKLVDRGLTLRNGALAQASVSIGPDAFSSWPLLASTIAHEVEVHCRQNFLAIHLMDVAGLDGTGSAEREAYGYELKNAARFGLAPYDQDLIRSTMRYYYPQKGFSVSEIPSIKSLVRRMSRLDTRAAVKPVDARSL